jgi:hypothetical protein
VFAESEDDEQIIERVAALDIGKAEVVCCVRLPAPAGKKRRVQEVTTHSTMVGSLSRPSASTEVFTCSLRLDVAMADLRSRASMASKMRRTPGSGRGSLLSDS